MSVPGPDLAAVTLDNAFDYGQANAGAVVIISAVQSLEDAKDFLSITLIKANAVILDVIDGFASLCPATHLNDCGLFLPVYLTALASKFTMTWLIKLGSPSAGGKSLTVNRKSLSGAWSRNCWKTFLTKTDRSMMDFLICCWPRREKASKSSMR